MVLPHQVYLELMLMEETFTTKLATARFVKQVDLLNVSLKRASPSGFEIASLKGADIRIVPLTHDIMLGYQVGS